MDTRFLMTKRKGQECSPSKDVYVDTDKIKGQLKETKSPVTVEKGRGRLARMHFFNLHRHCEMILSVYVGFEIHKNS